MTMKFSQTKKSARLDSRKRPLVDPSRLAVAHRREVGARRGFSLVESLVAIFIFSLISVMLGGAFSGFLKNYIKAKSAQRNSESAQYVMNLMAKNIRNGTVDSSFSSGGSTIKIFDNSTAKCVWYSYNAGKIQTYAVGGGTIVDIASCPAAAGTFTDMTKTGEIEALNFRGMPSVTAAKVGKIMISATVQGGDASRIQTTISLRQ